MAEAIRDAYADVFHVAEKPSEADRPAILGKFKSSLNSSDRVAEAQAATFLAILKLADMNATSAKPSAGTVKPPDMPKPASEHDAERRDVHLRYNIEIHLPPSKDPEVFNAIFKALKEHLIG